MRFGSILLLGASALGASPELRSPFAAPDRPLGGSPSAFTSCPRPPAPEYDLIGVNYYTDKRHSIVDPALERRNEQAFELVRRYAAKVIDLSEGYYGSRPPNAKIAACALDWLVFGAPF